MYKGETNRVAPRVEQTWAVGKLVSASGFPLGVAFSVFGVQESKLVAGNSKVYPCCTGMRSGDLTGG